jgi:streptogramin lyase
LLGSGRLVHQLPGYPAVLRLAATTVGTTPDDHQHEDHYPVPEPAPSDSQGWTAEPVVRDRFRKLRGEVMRRAWRLVVTGAVPVALLVGCSSTNSPMATSSGRVSSSAAAGSLAPSASASGVMTASAKGGSSLVADVGVDVALPLLPEFSSLAGHSIWYSDSNTGKVARLDLASGKVGAPIVIDDALDSPYGSPKEIAADDAGAWVADASRKSIDRVDRPTNRVTRRIVLATGAGGSRRSITPFGIELSGSTAWVTDFDQGLVAEVNTTTGRVTRVLDGVANPEGLALGFGSLWVVQHRAGSIARIDLKSWTVTAVIRLPGRGSNSICGMCVDQVVAGPSALWVPLDLGDAVAQIDPTTNTVTADTQIGLQVENLAVDATSVWVAGWDGSVPCTDTKAVLERLDPASGSPSGRIVIPCAFNPTVVNSSGHVWLGIADNPNAVSLIKPRG